MGKNVVTSYSCSACSSDGIYTPPVGAALLYGSGAYPTPPNN